jgi:hypothetical protein
MPAPSLRYLENGSGEGSHVAQGFLLALCQRRLPAHRPLFLGSRSNLQGDAFSKNARLPPLRMAPAWMQGGPHPSFFIQPLGLVGRRRAELRSLVDPKDSRVVEFEGDSSDGAPRAKARVGSFL